MTIKVIGTGFGRTGTDSMREALTILGFGPCHHMVEVLSNPDQKRMWRAVATGEAPDWDALLNGYASCMDWPSARYWPQLIDAYPTAKVILTWRTAESWWASFEKTILPLLLETTNDGSGPGSTMIADQVFEGRPADKASAIRLYEANVAAVKATVSPDRLLVHSLGDGWGPLCAHLGVPVPDMPYPQRNAPDDFAAKAAAFKAKAAAQPQS